MSATARQAGIEAMGPLRALLDDLGYAQLYAALAGGGLFPADRARAAETARHMGGEAGVLLRLLACDEPVRAGEVTGPLDDLAHRLQAATLLRSDQGLLRMDDLVVVAILGGYLLTATPPGWRTEPERSGRAYLGEDSLRLARAIPPATGKAVLDLGAGCGVQGLLAARGAGEVVLSDIEERSLELAQLNAHLNGLGASTEVVAGDCYEPVADRRFDLVVTLAPYLPSISRNDDPAVAAGADGLVLLRRVIAGAADHLRPGGELVTLAQLLCDDGGPLLRHELAQLAPSLEARLVCFDAHRLQPYALELATKLAASIDEPVGALLGRYMASLRPQGATGVCLAYLRLRAPAAGEGRPARSDAEPEVHLPRRLGATTVLDPAPGLRIGVDPNLHSAVVPDGPSQPLPAHVAALLAAFDGHRDLEAVVATAWGTPSGADPRDLLDQALERAGELERAGFLAPSRP